MIVVAIIVKPLVYHLYWLYRRYWVDASTRELLTISVATATASVVVALAVMLIILAGGVSNFPRSVIGIDWLVSLFSGRGLRLGRGGRVGMRGVVVVGAGDAGALVGREMQRNPQLHMLPVGFVDDDSEKHGKDIHGVRVSGTTRQLASVIERGRAG